MPELPDIEIYVESLRRLIVGARLGRIRLKSPFLLRTVTPPTAEAEGRTVRDVRRIGKRIAIALEEDLFLVLHLMIAGRLRWEAAGARIPARLGLAAFDFTTGTLLMTEAGTKRRAALHVVRGTAALMALDRGGLETIGSTRDAFARALRGEPHTLKRALTDPRLFSGIGNAYSDEILHRARLSPLARGDLLTEAQIAALHRATIDVLQEWTARLREECGGRFPGKVTAFREGMAVHGRHGRPCPDCGAPVQRIVYAENECNYCPGCQTGGRVLSDRLLSRLLKDDWPRRLEELEDAAPGGR